MSPKQGPRWTVQIASRYCTSREIDSLKLLNIIAVTITENLREVTVSSRLFARVHHELSSISGIKHNKGFGLVPLELHIARASVSLCTVLYAQ
jgi:hypothetical protein